MRVGGRRITLVSALLWWTLWRLAALRLFPFPITPDEAQYRFYALIPSWAYYSKPPGLPGLIAAAIALLGDTDFAVRCFIPLLHAVNALLIAGAVRNLSGNVRTAETAGITYALLPGVSYSSGLVTTDPPMMFGWCLALWAASRASAIGIALGMAVGTLAKYTAGVWWVSAFYILRHRRRMLLLALSGSMLLLWPHWAALQAGGWQTFRHTADNADAGNAGFHPVSMLAFLASQLAVAGGVAWLLPAALLRVHRTEAQRFFAAFTWPLLLMITAQALFSRAHANWAAPAYCAGCALLALTQGAPRMQRINRFHALIAVLLPLLNAAAPLLPAALDPGRDLRRFPELGREARQLMQTHRLDALLGDDRKTLSLLIHHTRLRPEETLTLAPAGRAKNHYQAEYALPPHDPRRLLYVRDARSCPDTPPPVPDHRVHELQRMQSDNKCTVFYIAEPA